MSNVFRYLSGNFAKPLIGQESGKLKSGWFKQEALGRENKPKLNWEDGG